MSARTRRCCECGKVRERCRPAVQRLYGFFHVIAEVEWVCPKCWRDLEYFAFLKPHVPEQF